jgi:flagellar export protein FliJ
MDALGTLLRLARQRLDEERHALAAVGAEALRLEVRLRELREARVREQAALGAEMAGRALLSAYLESARRHERALAAELLRLEQARAAQLARLLARRTEVERLDLLAARRQRQAAVAGARREQREVDDLVATRRAAHRSRPGAR